MAVSAQLLTDSLQQTILIALGSALFGASLSFFLVRMFSLMEKYFKQFGSLFLAIRREKRTSPIEN